MLKSAREKRDVERSRERDNLVDVRGRKRRGMSVG
jgi:hypothetical protein